MSQEFYLTQKIVPAIPNLFLLLWGKNKLAMEWDFIEAGHQTDGLHMEEITKQAVILVEWQDILNLRSCYIMTISRISCNTSWADSNLTFNRCWQKKGGMEDIMATGNASKKVIIVHIGSEKGFLIGRLLIYKARAATWDYHGQMNAENFEKCMSSQVLPNLQSGSAAGMDNTHTMGSRLKKHHQNMV
jgi:hypothetical protein